MPISAASVRVASAGRGSPGKMPIVAAVEITKDGKPVRLKIRRVKRFDKSRIKTIAKRIFKPGTKVVTGGLACFRGIADAGCTHEAIVTGSGRKAARHPAFKWVNTALGNVNNAPPSAPSAESTHRAPLPSSSTASTGATILPQ
jgi:hypothetical protein